MLLGGLVFEPYPSSLKTPNACPPAVDVSGVASPSLRAGPRGTKLLSQRYVTLLGRPLESFFLSVVVGILIAVIVPSSGQTCIQNPTSPFRREPVAHPDYLTLQKSQESASFRGSRLHYSVFYYVGLYYTMLHYNVSYYVALY